MRAPISKVCGIWLRGGSHLFRRCVERSRITSLSSTRLVQKSQESPSTRVQLGAGLKDELRREVGIKTSVVEHRVTSSGLFLGPSTDSSGTGIFVESDPRTNGKDR